MYAAKIRRPESPGASLLKQRLADNISLVAQSPGLKLDEVEVAVTIPTFRRPDHVIRTLDSVRAQVTGRHVAIIVMENDAEGREGVTAAAAKFEDGAYYGMMVIAHDRGNCNAYNAGWFTALTSFPNLKYVAVIDDDEIAEPQWVETLCTVSETYDCALVGGPQLPVFEGNAPAAWQKHPVFTPHYFETGPVPIIYSSGNLLIRSDVLRKMPQPFMDLRFNFTGGGDSDFLHRSRAQGFKIAWANEAIVHETVPERRASWEWIQARSLRNGVLSAWIDHRMRKDEPFGRAKAIAKSVALLAASPLRFARRFMQSGSVLCSLYPVHIALGRIMSEFGYANEQYRNPEKN